jgi:crossover junction endodeoxyribonuclease RuvC
MVVFGIDPGSTVTAYGVVRSERSRYHLVDVGYVTTRADQPMGERLLAIHRGLRAALERNAVDAVAIESIFRHKSSESALRLGQARGVALLAAAEHGFTAYEYNNATVKRTVGAHGQADKAAVATMVRLMLGAPPPDGPVDQSDALAIAITHLSYARNGALARP